jgi:putative restriction endonuclease
MDKKTDESFTWYLRRAAEQAKREINYYPGFFHKMLNNEGGYRTAVRLLDPSKPVSEGFVKLWEAGRLDLTVEALVIKKPWSDYFAQPMLEAARKRLRDAGFRSEPRAPRSAQADDTTQTRKVSSLLEVGQVYTRDQLRERFDITDATLDTGIFQPKGFDSVWLFVTEKKTPDRTQYEDRLDGDVLHWQGQTSGRKDRLIIGHKHSALELLLFYRRAKYEHPRAGFRFEGVFEYVSHTGANPASFILSRMLDGLDALQRQAERSGAFSPNSIEDARQRTLSAIVQRRGQTAFRASLLGAYGCRCAISGCETEAVLEAAHIFPYRGDATNHVTNGLLLRADLHTLFDLGLFAIDERGTVVLSEALKEGSYAWLSTAKIRWPPKADGRPSAEALLWHRTKAGL